RNWARLIIERAPRSAVGNVVSLRGGFSMIPLNRKAEAIDALGNHARLPECPTRLDLPLRFNAAAACGDFLSSGSNSAGLYGLTRYGSYKLSALSVVPMTVAASTPGPGRATNRNRPSASESTPTAGEVSGACGGFPRRGGRRHRNMMKTLIKATTVKK